MLGGEGFISVPKNTRGFWVRSPEEVVILPPSPEARGRAQWVGGCGDHSGFFVLLVKTQNFQTNFYSPAQLKCSTSTFRTSTSNREISTGDKTTPTAYSREKGLVKQVLICGGTIRQQPNFKKL